MGAYFIKFNIYVIKFDLYGTLKALYTDKLT